MASADSPSVQHAHLSPAAWAQKEQVQVGQGLPLKRQLADHPSIPVAASPSCRSPVGSGSRLSGQEQAREVGWCLRHKVLCVLWKLRLGQPILML